MLGELLEGGEVGKGFVALPKGKSRRGGGGDLATRVIGGGLSFEPPAQVLESEKVEKLRVSLLEGGSRGGG